MISSEVCATSGGTRMELKDHRLEAGGFDSRLEVRLIWDPEKAKMQAPSPAR